MPEISVARLYIVMSQGKHQGPAAELLLLFFKVEEEGTCTL